MHDRLRIRGLDRLAAAVVAVRTRAEAIAFFEDLCTVAELRSMSQRLEVAELLAGGATYADVAERTGASSATISRVNRSLEYGADGYKQVLALLDAAALEEADDRRRDQCRD
ncbi:MAG: YerC/YecD family TrpR-related protein [Bacillota bacterium]|nr:YerC/YecD family TrpR-related protein [Bacillota bacterium]